MVLEVLMLTTDGFRRIASSAKSGTAKAGMAVSSNATKTDKERNKVFMDVILLSDCGRVAGPARLGEKGMHDVKI
jgi:hypothetical protein